MVQATDGMLNEFLQTAAVLRYHRDAHLVFMQRRVDNGRYAIPQRRNCSITNGAITELLDSAGTFHQRNTGGVINTELSFEAGLWRFLARELHHKRMDSQLDTVDFVGRQFVFI